MAQTNSTKDQPVPSGKVSYSEVEAPDTSMKKVASIADNCDHNNVSNEKYYSK